MQNANVFPDVDNIIHIIDDDHSLQTDDSWKYETHDRGSRAEVALGCEIWNLKNIFWELLILKKPLVHSIVKAQTLLTEAIRDAIFVKIRCEIANMCVPEVGKVVPEIHPELPISFTLNT